MYNNPEKIKELCSLIAEKKGELTELQNILSAEVKKMPEGYELLNPGDVVPAGSICWGSDCNCWYKAGNSVGKKLNEDGFISGITLKGYIYARPI